MGWLRWPDAGRIRAAHPSAMFQTRLTLLLWVAWTMIWSAVVVYCSACVLVDAGLAPVTGLEPPPIELTQIRLILQQKAIARVSRIVPGVARRIKRRAEF
jgi:hypothetical protein